MSKNINIHFAGNGFAAQIQCQIEKNCPKFGDVTTEYFSIAISHIFILELRITDREMSVRMSQIIKWDTYFGLRAIRRRLITFFLF